MSVVLRNYDFALTLSATLYSGSPVWNIFIFICVKKIVTATCNLISYLIILNTCRRNKDFFVSHVSCIYYFNNSRSSDCYDKKRRQHWWDDQCLFVVVAWQINKPLVERRRRERINVCIDELKSLLATQRQVLFRCLEVINRLYCKTCSDECD